jgi:hypothetical protein
MPYAIILLVIVISLAVRHASIPDPSPLSKLLVGCLTAGPILVLLMWPHLLILTSFVVASIGVYVILHQMVTTWNRELAEADRPANKLRDESDRTFPQKK